MSMVPLAPSPAQPPGKHRYKALILAFLVPGLLLFLFLISAGPARPLLMHDTAYGLLTWDNWMKGETFNSLPRPDPANIAQDQQVFLAWWSPGQYLIPGGLSSCGIPLGLALSLTSLLGALSSFGGWFLLARRLGLSCVQALLLATAQTLGYHLLRNFGSFIGGDLLVQASLPWFLLAALTLVQPPPLSKSLPALTGLLLLGAFLKHSFLPPLLGIAAHLISNEWIQTNRLPPRRRLVRSLALAAAAGLAVLLWKVFYLSRGDTPAGQGNPAPPMAAFGYPLLAPWLSLTGAGALLGRVAFLSGHSIEMFWLSHGGYGLVLGLPLLASVLRILPRHPTPVFARLCLWVTAATIIPLALLHLKGASVAMEDRLYYPAGACLLAFLFLARPSLSRTGSFLVSLTLCLATALGLASAAQRVWNGRHPACISLHGYVQQQVSPELLEALHQLDAPGAPSTLFLISPPEVALEIRHHRHTTSRPGPETLWYGTVPRLVVMEQAPAGPLGTAPSCEAGLPGFSGSQWTALSFENWILWIASPPTPRAKDLTPAGS